MIYIIANRISGKGKGAVSLAKMENRLNEHGAQYKTFISEYIGHSTELAKQVCLEADCEMIIAIGGDGTFSEVVSGMDLDVPITLFPAGTGNDFATGAELLSDENSAVDAALSGSLGRFDILSVNGRRCLNIAGTGFDVNVLLMEKKIRKILPGKISYMLALLISLISVKFTDVELCMDEGDKRKLSVLLVAAANGKYYGGGMPISLDAEYDDGYIDLVIIKKLPRIKIPYLFIKFFQGKLKEVTKYVEVHRCKKVDISTYEELPMNLDGELFDMALATVEVKKHAIQAVTVVGNASKVNS